MRQLELPLPRPAPTWIFDRSGQPAGSQTDLEGGSPQEKLTPRRRQVLSLYLLGKSRKEIARQLDVSPNTVRNHIRLIYEQLGFTNRVEALRWALEQPSLSRQLLSRSTHDVERPRAFRNRAENREPISIEKMMSEAITFYQRLVIESTLEPA